MDNSPFASLPAELRVRIFEYALTQDLEVLKWQIEEDGSLVRVFHPPFGAIMSLTQTCKQVRSESIDLFFKCNNFCIIFSSDGFMWGLPKSANRIGAENAAAIKSLRLQVFMNRTMARVGCLETEGFLDLVRMAEQNKHWDLRLDLHCSGHENQAFVVADMRLNSMVSSLQRAIAKYEGLLHQSGFGGWNSRDLQEIASGLRSWLEALEQSS